MGDNRRDAAMAQLDDLLLAELAKPVEKEVMSDYPVSVALWREKLHVGEARVLDGERQVWGYDPMADAEIWQPVRVVGLKPVKRAGLRS